jgi:glycerophosphoryl diester phosphodiesterase
VPGRAIVPGQPGVSVERPARPMVVAHRGASIEQPENTIEAFEAAIDAAADAVEFDVRMTADGHAVVMHDPDVSRTTDATGLVSEMTLDQFRKLGVPTLVETLECLSGRAAADIEIKNLPGEPDFTPDREAAVEVTLDTLDAVGFSGQVIVSSFNPASIAHSRALRPDVPTGLLTEYEVDADEALARATAQGHPWVLPFVSQVLDAGEGFADQVHDGGALLGVWIADDPETARRLLELGADAVATNDPRAIVPVRNATSPKRRFLVANDYGSGAVWASVLAHSAETIALRYPSLVLVDEPPSWLDAERLQELEERMTVDIDDDKHPFLKAAKS